MPTTISGTGGITGAVVNVNSLLASNLAANYSVVNVTDNKTFTDADKSKVFHFQTTANSTLSANFPNTLSNGFNVGIVNIGQGTIHFTSTQTPSICASSTMNTYPFTGVTIYKVEGTLFGLGVFD